MNLHRLIAEYRKISRRLRRRALVTSARQIQSWKRRLATLEQRIRLAGGRTLRRVAMASVLALPALGLHASPALAAAGNGNFAFRDDHKSMLPTRYINGWSNSGDGYYQAAAFGDVDGDGDLDAFVVNGSYSYIQLHFLKNEGTRQSPNFVQQTGADDPVANYGHMPAYWYQSLALADVDGDGDLDLVMGTYNGIRYLKNVGTRTKPVFQEQFGADNPFSAVYAEYYYVSATLGDMDGDGDLDLIVGTGRDYYPDPVRYFENTGTKTAPVFTERTYADNPFHGFRTYEYSRYYLPALVDIDGDGDLDVVMGGYRNSTIELWENTGTKSHAQFSDRGIIPGIYTDNASMTFADIDGDGDQDLFMGQNDFQGVFLFENKGTASHFKFSQALMPYNNVDRNDVFVDLDGDGDLDFAGRDMTLRNDGGALYDMRYSASGYQFPTYTDDSQGRAFADFDGDGDMDGIVFREYCCPSYGGVAFLRNDGNFNFHYMGAYDSSNPFRFAHPNYLGYYQYSAVGDIDGDGDLDVLAVDSSNRRVLLNEGTPSAPIFYDESYNGGYDPFSTSNIYFPSQNQKPFLVDFDHDGDADLVLFPSYGGSPTYYRNDSTPGSPKFTAVSGSDDPFNGVVIPSNGGGYIFAEDIDGDGDVDFLINDYYSSDWKILINNMPRFTAVDPLAKQLDKITLGPVPAKTGEDVCLFLDQPTDSVNFELFNLAGERVISGLKSAVPGSTPCFTADIAPGLYWAKIKSGDRTFTQKLIITAK